MIFWGIVIKHLLNNTNEYTNTWLVMHLHPYGSWVEQAYVSIILYKLSLLTHALLAMMAGIKQHSSYILDEKLHLIFH